MIDGLQSNVLVWTGQHPWRGIPTDWDGPIVSRFLEKMLNLATYDLINIVWWDIRGKL